MAHSTRALRDDVVVIRRLKTLDRVQIEPLLKASRGEGFRFLARLWKEWANGENRFEQRGDALFGLLAGARLVGIGGVNRQDKFTGRLRRFYILPSHRRRGWGRRLLRHILRHAAAHFRWVELRTDTEAADRFYVACGFSRIRDARDATHRIELTKSNRKWTPMDANGKASLSRALRSR